MLNWSTDGHNAFEVGGLRLVVVACAGGCRQRPADGADAEVVRRGSVEVTAELVEIPDKFLTFRCTITRLC